MFDYHLNPQQLAGRLVGHPLPFDPHFVHAYINRIRSRYTDERVATAIWLIDQTPIGS